MAAPPVLFAFAFVIILLSLWAGWVMRTHRGGARIKLVPVATLFAVAIFEILAVHTLRNAGADVGAAEAGNKASLLANGISRGMHYVAMAWGSIGLAVIILGIASLRAPRDPDAPSARVVREPRQDR